MNAVGIDVSKEKSTVAVLRPQGIVVASPYDVSHTGSDLKALVTFIRNCMAKLVLLWRQQATIMDRLPVFSTNKVYLFP